MSIFNSVTYNIDSCFPSVDICMYSSFSYKSGSDTKSTMFINHSKKTIKVNGRHQIIFQYSKQLFDFEETKQGQGKVQLTSYNWYVFKIALRQYIEKVVPRIFSRDPDTNGMMFIDVEQYVELRRAEDAAKGIIPRNMKTFDEYSEEMVFSFVAQGTYETILTFMPTVTEREFVNEEFDNVETVSGYPAFAMYINHETKRSVTDLYGFRAFCEKINELNFDNIASNNALIGVSNATPAYTAKTDSSKQTSQPKSKVVTRRNPNGNSLKTSFSKDK